MNVMSTTLPSTLAPTTEPLRIAPRTARAGVRFRRPDDEPALAAPDGEEIVVLSLAEGVTTVGRSFRADLELEDPSVSRRHARLERLGRRVWLLDEGSVNGVHVNGARVSRRLLRHGDQIQFGRVVMRFMAPRGP
jgi:pSer/pThr/pTyr-binding forkhead associated (FHA) protein